MTSAVLPTQNEHYRSECGSYLRQFPSNCANSPHFNRRWYLNPNPNSYNNQVCHPNYSRNDLLLSNAPSSRPPLLPLGANDDAPPVNQNKAAVPAKDSFHREHVTFHLSSYSASELKELKMRLFSELERVRSLLTRIETRNLVLGRGIPCPQNCPPGVERNPPKPLDPPANQQAPKALPAVLGSGKKNEKVLGQKRAQPSAVGREAKRPVLGPLSSSMMKKCRQILTSLMAHRCGYIFNKPVDVKALNLYDYYDIIKHPMDLGTIKSRLSKSEYKSPLHFAADVRLTFGNALKYNPPGSRVHREAESLLSRFEKMFGKEYPQHEAQKQKIVAGKKNPNVIDSACLDSTPMIPKEAEGKLVGYRCTEPILLSSPSFKRDQASLPRNLRSKMGKLPKPKAKDPNKRKMTLKERAELACNLQDMPEEKLEQIVDIVRKRNPGMIQDGEEVVLDTEALDNETLWDLDRFVSNHRKKALFNMKKQEFRCDAITLIQDDPNTKSSVSDHHQMVTLENMKKGDAGDEDVDIGEDFFPNDFPPVEIDKDPTGANSTGSDSSSSSDSDSSSSSESDSDEDSDQSPWGGQKGFP